MILSEVVHGELNIRKTVSDISALISELHSHSQNDEDIEIVLDYAMQIRMEVDDIPWNEAMECAMTFYFG